MLVCVRLRRRPCESQATRVNCATRAADVFGLMNVSLRTVNSPPGSACCRASSRIRASRRRVATKSTKVGKTGSLSRVRLRDRDWRCFSCLTVRVSSELMGQRTAQGPQRAGSSAGTFSPRILSPGTGPSGTSSPHPPSPGTAVSQDCRTTRTDPDMVARTGRPRTGELPAFTRSDDLASLVAVARPVWTRCPALLSVACRRRRRTTASALRARCRTSNGTGPLALHPSRRHPRGRPPPTIRQE